tara:strand:- start:1557 stop:2153 length:597 start_codon:yes stop_codon:yes gene_type:complete
VSFRKEKKYRLSYSDMALLQAQLLGNGMVVLYPSRKINSCYFDNQEMAMFEASEEGVLPRKKIRVRWYSESSFKKETKVSSVEGRFKTVKQLKGIPSIDSLIRKSFFDNLYGLLKAVLIVSYTRSYFTLDSLRITFDRNISYTFVKGKKKNLMYDRECVMEVKVPIDCPDDYIESIIMHPTGRFSKYARGLLASKRML